MGKESTALKIFRHKSIITSIPSTGILPSENVSNTFGHIWADFQGLIKHLPIEWNETEKREKLKWLFNCSKRISRIFPQPLRLHTKRKRIPFWGQTARFCHFHHFYDSGSIVMKTARYLDMIHIFPWQRANKQKHLLFGVARRVEIIPFFSFVELAKYTTNYIGGKVQKNNIFFCTNLNFFLAYFWRHFR